MEEKLSKPEMGSGVFAVPQSIEEPAVTFDWKRLIPCLTAYTAGWLFMNIWEAPVYVILLGVLFSLWTLCTARGKQHTCEHWLWFAAMWSLLIYLSFGPVGFSWGEQFTAAARDAVNTTSVHLWSESLLPVLMLFVLPQYWALHALGLTADDASGSLFPLDLDHAWIELPFRCFFARIRTIAEQLHALSRSLKQSHGSSFGYGLLTLLIALGFLAAAVPLLSAADAGFSSLMQGLLSDVSFRGLSLAALVRFMFSIPVGAYLYSLITGSQTLDRTWLDQRKTRLRTAVDKARRLPAGCWIAVLGGFAALYLLFLGLHVRELIPVLSSRLAPGDMTMSEWAVRGFFELCALMGLNLVLLLTVHTTSARALHECASGKLLMSVILFESLAFAVSAAIKLCLYVAAFGFTPLRLQGAWAILELSACCVCAIVWLWTGRHMMRAWRCFTALTLCLTFFL